MGMEKPSGIFINGIFTSKPAMLASHWRGRTAEENRTDGNEYAIQRGRCGALEAVISLNVLSIDWKIGIPSALGYRKEVLIPDW